MEFLSEDATYLAGTLGLIACGFIIALRVTQQGKYLIRAVVAVALALFVLAVERIWVTDNERIEAVVYKLGKAVEAGDTAGAIAEMTPDVQYVAGGDSLPGGMTRGMIKEAIAKSKFDFLRVNHLTATAGGQSRRGTAEFRVIASGSFQGGFNQLNFGTHNSSWSLGFKETGPGVWKVNRITPVNVPGAQYIPSLGLVAGGPREGRPSPRFPDNTPPATGPFERAGGVRGRNALNFPISPTDQVVPIP